MDKILCVSEIIFPFSDPRQQITDELRYMKTRLKGLVNVIDSHSVIYILLLNKSILLQEYDHARARNAHMYAEVLGYGLSGTMVAE